VYINGGRIDTGKDALAWAKELESRGAGEILLTSMDCDGTKNGYDIALTSQMSQMLNIPVIASGGAGTMAHIKEAFLHHADAALAASIFHFKEIDIMDLKRYLHREGISVRL
jgi:cyclase